MRCPRKGFLVLSDSFHRAWRAKVDGVETPVLRANYIMMAVPLNVGSRRVEIRFEHNVLYLGLIMTALGWTTLAALIVLSACDPKWREDGRVPESNSSGRPADP